MSLRAVSRLHPKSTALFVCDLQEKFKFDIPHLPETIGAAKKMVEAAKILKLETIVAENNPKKYGRTVAELGICPETPVYEKTEWSMCSLPIDRYLVDVKNVLIVGIAAHACVLHTAYDLLEGGIGVHVIVDAVSSRNLTDRQFGLKQMEQAGAVMTTSESTLLALVGGSDHPQFKEIQKLIMTPTTDDRIVSQSMKM